MLSRTRSLILAVNRIGAPAMKLTPYIHSRQFSMIGDAFTKVTTNKIEGDKGILFMNYSFFDFNFYIIGYLQRSGLSR
jgi:hypothetical protein